MIARAELSPASGLRPWLVATLGGYVFLAVAGWEAALGDVLALPSLVGLPVSGALGFGLLMLFHRAVRRAAARATGTNTMHAPDESRLLGFLLPAVVPFLRPFVEVGLLQSAAGLAARAGGAPRTLKSIVVLSWLRVVLELLAWGSLWSASPGGSVLPVLATASSIVVLAIVLHLVVQPLLEADEQKAMRQASLRSAGCEDSVAVAVLQGPLPA